MTIEAQDLPSGVSDIVTHNKWAVGLTGSVTAYVCGFHKSSGVEYTENRKEALVFADYQTADKLRTLIRDMGLSDQLYTCFDLTEGE